jgi:hypothetical protein
LLAAPYVLPFQPPHAQSTLSTIWNLQLLSPFQSVLLPEDLANRIFLIVDVIPLLSFIHAFIIIQCAALHSSQKPLNIRNYCHSIVS